jgi:hypothetical protein
VQCGAVTGILSKSGHALRLGSYRNLLSFVDVSALAHATNAHSSQRIQTKSKLRRDIWHSDTPYTCTNAYVHFDDTHTAQTGLDAFRQRADKSRLTPHPPSKNGGSRREGSPAGGLLGRFLKAGANQGRTLRFLGRATAATRTTANW